ncbi:MAG: hypothetical protein J6V54_02605, partial [Bacteroidales bacterium]|nr:hypothetical protein [Bacteroidales bacterium]
ISLIAYDIIMIFVIIVLWWLSLPAIIASIIIFFINIRCRNVLEIVTTIWGIFNVLLLVIVFSQSGCTPDKMAKHYDAHCDDMEELHNYVKTAIDDSCSIDLEFDGKRAGIFHVSDASGEYQNHWNEEAELLKDSLMTLVGLSEEEYKNIRKQLKDMDCLGIKFSQLSSDRMTIYFCREGMGRYSYNIYSRPLTEKEKCNAIEDLALIPYNEYCIFEYGGGAIGPQTFTTEEKEEFMKRNNNM